MPSDKEQKKSPEEEAEEKKYSFLREKISPTRGSFPSSKYLSKDSVHFSISHTSIKNPQISCYQQQERFAHTLPQTGDSHMSSIVNRT